MAKRRLNPHTQCFQNWDWCLQSVLQHSSVRYTHDLLGVSLVLLSDSHTEVHLCEMLTWCCTLLVNLCQVLLILSHIWFFFFLWFSECHFANFEIKQCYYNLCVYCMCFVNRYPLRQCLPSGLLGAKLLHDLLMPEWRLVLPWGWHLCVCSRLPGHILQKM